MNSSHTINQWEHACQHFSEEIRYKTFCTLSARERFLRNSSYEHLLIPDILLKHIKPNLPSVRQSNSKDLNTLLILYKKDGTELNIHKESCRAFSRNIPTQGELHTHDYIEIFYVISGTFSQVLLNQTYTFHAGDVVITDKNCEHADIFNGNDASVLFLCVNFSYMEALLKYNPAQNELQRFLFHAISNAKQEQSFLVFSPSETTSDRAIPQSVTHFDNIDVILEQLIEEEYRSFPGSESIIKGLFIRLLFCLGKDYTMMRYADKRSGHDQILLFEIEKIIRDAPSNITTALLEKKFHYHRNYYNHLFQKYRGKSLREYIQEIRIKKACELLESTDFSVKKIANMVGYENTNFFYNLFEKITGTKPKQYRSNQLSSNKAQKHI